MRSFFRSTDEDSDVEGGDDDDDAKAAASALEQFSDEDYNLLEGSADEFDEVFASSALEEDEAEEQEVDVEVEQEDDESVVSFLELGDRHHARLKVKKKLAKIRKHGISKLRQLEKQQKASSSAALQTSRGGPESKEAKALKAAKPEMSPEQMETVGIGRGKGGAFPVPKVGGDAMGKGGKEVRDDASDSEPAGDLKAHGSGQFSNNFANMVVNRKAAREQHNGKLPDDGSHCPKGYTHLIQKPLKSIKWLKQNKPGEKRKIEGEVSIARRARP